MAGLWVRCRVVVYGNGDGDGGGGDSGGTSVVVLCGGFSVCRGAAICTPGRAFGFGFGGGDNDSGGG